MRRSVDQVARRRVNEGKEERIFEELTHGQEDWQRLRTPGQAE